MLLVCDRYDLIWIQWALLYLTDGAALCSLLLALSVLLHLCKKAEACREVIAQFCCVKFTISTFFLKPGMEMNMTT